MKFGNTFIKSLLVLIIICYIQCRKKGINKGKDASSLNTSHSLDLIDDDSYNLSASNDGIKLSDNSGMSFANLMNELKDLKKKLQDFSKSSNKDSSITKSSLKKSKKKNSNQNNLDFELNSSFFDDNDSDTTSKNIKKQKTISNISNIKKHKNESEEQENDDLDDILVINKNINENNKENNRNSQFKKKNTSNINNDKKKQKINKAKTGNFIN